MIEIFGNNAATTLAAGIGPGAVSCTLLAGTGSKFPSPGAGQYFRMTFTDALTGNVREVVFVTGRTGDVLTIVRAQESTSAQSWLAGDAADNLNTAGAMGNMSQQQQVQLNIFNYCNDAGSANAYNLTYTPNNMQTPVPGAILYFLANNPNTTTSTVVVNGGSTYPLLGQARLPLQGGEINQFTAITFDAPQAAYVVLFSTGGVPQAPTTTKTNQVLTYGSAIAFFAKLNGDASVPFASSQINTSVVRSPTTTLALQTQAGGGANFTDQGGINLIPVNGAKGTVNSTSTQFVTGAQLQGVWRVGQMAIWHGSSANISTVWGPGWQMADGTNGTLDMRNKMPIGAGVTYAVGASGGSTTATLSVANMPAHNHAMYDPGHAHSVADPTHAHGVADPGHAHGVGDPGHAHSIPHLGSAQAGSDNGGVAVPVSNSFGTGTNSANVNGSGTGIWIGASGVGIGIYGAYTGIGIYANTTGIQTLNNGSGTAFPILPPYVGVLFLEYTGIGA